jgi:hypothetical protein
MPGSGHRHKIPRAGMGALSVTGAQFIAPLQQIGQTVDIQPQLSGGFAGAVSMPSHRRIFAGEPAQIVTQFNS